jgi:DNA-binding NarL/FixJ family response regulator
VTRILIADDHEVVRFGLRAILEAHEGWEVVAEACDGKEAIAKAVETSPDVAIIDYSLPMINGVEATRQIRARVPTAEVLIFTMHDSEVLVGELLEAGARAYLLKSDAKQYLIAAVESLVSHKPFFTGKVSEQLLERTARRRCASSTSLRPLQSSAMPSATSWWTPRSTQIAFTLSGTHSDTRADPSITGRPPLCGTTRLKN